MWVVLKFASEAEVCRVLTLETFLEVMKQMQALRPGNHRSHEADLMKSGVCVTALAKALQGLQMKIADLMSLQETPIWTLVH